MKTKDISIRLREVRCCNSAPSDLIYIALSEPPVFPHLYFWWQCLKVPTNLLQNMPRKGVCTCRRSLDRHGGLRLCVKTPSSYQHLEWAEAAENQQNIVGSLSRCMNTSDGRALYLLSCLSIRTASWKREGDFSVILNTFILKVIKKNGGLHRDRANQWKTGTCWKIS